METTNYGWILATVGSSTDTWGTLTNTVFDEIDTQVFTNASGLAGKLNLSGGTMTGDLTGTMATFATSVTSPSFVGALSGNAASATKLSNNRTFKLEGVVTSDSQAFNGTAPLTLITDIADGDLTIAMTSGLQTALDAKLALTGGTMTGDIIQDTKGVYLYHADSANASGSMTVSTSAPSGGADGDIWFKI